MRLFVLLKTIHGWTGALLLPWLLVIGLTGFYLNHRNMLGGVFDENVDEPMISASSLSEDQTALIARKIVPDVDATLLGDEVVYHERQAFTYEIDDRREIVVERDNGLVHLKTDFTRTVYDRAGVTLDRKIYWSRILKQLHTDGWLGGRFGLVLADLVSLAMVGFSLSGIYLFMKLRLRRKSARSS